MKNGVNGGTIASVFLQENAPADCTQHYKERVIFLRRKKEEVKTVEKLIHLVDELEEGIKSFIKNEEFVKRVDKYLKNLRTDIKMYAIDPAGDKSQIRMIAPDGKITTLEGWRAHLEVIKAQDPQLYDEYMAEYEEFIDSMRKLHVLHSDIY